MGLEQLPISSRKINERQCGTSNNSANQAPATRDEELETGYNASLGNRNAPNCQYGELLLQRNSQSLKTIPTQTLLRINNQRLGLDEARIRSGKSNDLCLSSREQRRNNGGKVKPGVEEYNELKWRLETAE